MSAQLSLLDPPVDELAAKPLGMPRVNGRLQFSDTPHNFALELAAIVADEQRLHAEQRRAS